MDFLVSFSSGLGGGWDSGGEEGGCGCVVFVVVVVVVVLVDSLGDVAGWEGSVFCVVGSGCAVVVLVVVVVASDMLEP